MGKPGTAAVSSRSSSRLFYLKLTVTEILTQGRTGWHTPQPPSLCSFPKYYSNKLGLLLVTFQGSNMFSSDQILFGFFIQVLRKLPLKCLLPLQNNTALKNDIWETYRLSMSWSPYVIQILEKHEPLFTIQMSLFNALRYTNEILFTLIVLNWKQTF